MGASECPWPSTNIFLSGMLAETLGRNRSGIAGSQSPDDPKSRPLPIANGKAIHI